MGQQLERSIPRELDCDRNYYDKLIRNKKLAPYSEGEEEDEGENQICCTICCHSYNVGLNNCIKCNQGVCTKCYVNIKPFRYDSSRKCPFCNNKPYDVSYVPLLTKLTSPSKNKDKLELYSCKNTHSEYIEQMIKKRFDDLHQTTSATITPPNNNNDPYHHTQVYLDTSLEQHVFNEMLTDRIENKDHSFSMSDFIPSEFENSNQSTDSLDEELLQQAIRLSAQTDDGFQQFDSTWNPENEKLNPHSPHYDEDYATQYLLNLTRETIV